MKTYFPRSLPLSPAQSMQPRQGIVELFSTFVRFDSDRFAGWITDPKLHRCIQNCLRTTSGVSEVAWVLYWCRLWKERESGQWTVDSGQPGSQESEVRGQESGEEGARGMSHEAREEPESRAASHEPRATSHPKIQNPKSKILSATSHELRATSHPLIQNPPNLPLSHLTAYLQEPCYWVSRKVAGNTTGQSVADLFQTAIARTPSILNGFNPQLSTNLKSYAEFVFSNAIKDTLRQRQEADICTDWALLHKTSQRRLVQALEQVGLDAQTIASYVLAWNCFKELDTASDIHQTRKLTRPEAATWIAIAQLYNSQKLSQPSALQRDGTPERLEQWLLSCARAIRAYLYPRPVSVDTPKGNEDSPTLLETLPSSEQDSLLTQLMVQEELRDRQQQQQQLATVLTTAMTDLDPQSQQILQAYYSENLTQQQIAQQFEMKQYTVSRRLTSIRQTLLKRVVQWGQETLHISLNSDVLSSMGTLLDEWLRAYYHPSDT